MCRVVPRPLDSLWVTSLVFQRVDLRVVCRVLQLFTLFGFGMSFLSLRSLRSMLGS